MACSSPLSLYPHPQVGLRNQSLQSLALTCVVQFAPLPGLNCQRVRFRNIVRFRSFVIKVSSSVEGTRPRPVGSRRIYRQSQAHAPLSSAPMKQIANVVGPFAVLVAVTFVIWKLVEKLLVPVPKPLKSSTVEGQLPSQGLKWSLAAGTNLMSQLGAKIERQSKYKLNEFARELRSFPSVDMSGRNFGDEGLFFLAESLAFNQVVLTVGFFSFITHTSAVWYAISALNYRFTMPNAAIRSLYAKPDFPLLTICEEVSFAANGITAAGLRAFDGVLQSNITLKTLDLSGNLVGDEGAKVSPKCFSEFRIWCLCDILANNSSIEKLQLNSADLGDAGAKAIAEMLKKNSSLRVLELNNNMIEYSGFSSLAGALLENNSIRNIHLNGNYGGALGANALAKALESNKLLRELHLHGNSIGDEGIRSLMAGLSAHKGKLTLLDIGNNSLTSKGAFHVAEYVKKSRSLLWLNLYMNDIGDEGAGKIAAALKENRSITTLDLGGNNIHADGVNAVAQVFKDNLIITTLELSYNPIGPDGAKALAEVLKFHGNIKTLKLGWCQIGAKGAEFIADALKYNTTISILDLRANGLRDEGAQCLARSLKVVNEALTSLDLGFNEIREIILSLMLSDSQDDGAFAIAQALKSNDDVAVTSLNIASNFLTKFGQGALADARDHVLEMTQKEINIFL
ncbi:hypothetical protein V8G54_016542 [Vigna mungo]|uniref:Protein NLRC3 n=1 Tax=Vigna mungo TaxID=3915 RepID=A0AAQ3NMM6_VIGMU